MRLLRPSAVHPDRRLATPSRVRGWTAAGVGVNVWTVDEPEQVAALAAEGAAAVISNVPGTAREAVRRATGR